MDKIIFHIDVNSAFLSWEDGYRLAHKGGRAEQRKIATAVRGDLAVKQGIMVAINNQAKR